MFKLSPSRSLCALVVLGVASSTVSNLKSCFGSSQDLQQFYNTCVGDEVHDSLQDDDCNKVNDVGYAIMYNETIDVVPDGGIPYENLHRISYMALLCMLWYLVFTNFELHQLVLVQMFLCIIGLKDTELVVVSYIFVGFIRMIFKMYPLNYSNHEDEVRHDFDYFQEEQPMETTFFSVGLSRWTFAFVVRTQATD